MSLVVRKPVYGVSDRSGTKQAVQPPEMASGGKFRIKIQVGLNYPCSDCAVTAQLICVFVFKHEKNGFLITRLKS